MTYTISMDKAGRIVIPKEVRNKIRATRFDLAVVLDRIELNPKADTDHSPSLVEEDGVWVIRGTGSSGRSIAEAVREERDDRADHLVGTNLGK